MKKRAQVPSGFSLTETVIALGLFAFCILPIVGMIPVGMGAVRSVSQEAAAANVAEAFFGAWQVRPPNVTKFPIPVMFPDPAGVPLTQGSGTNYFDGTGAQVTDPGAATMSMAYAVTTNSNSATISLDFTWPPPVGSGSNPVAQKRSFTRVIAL